MYAYLTVSYQLNQSPYSQLINLLNALGNISVRLSSENKYVKSNLLVALGTKSIN